MISFILRKRWSLFCFPLEAMIKVASTLVDRPITVSAESNSIAIGSAKVSTVIAGERIKNQSMEAPLIVSGCL